MNNIFYFTFSRFLQLSLLVLIALFAFMSKAEFGKTCEYPSNEYLSDEIINKYEGNFPSVAGYVRSLIDIQNCRSSGCSNINEGKMNICIKDVDGVSDLKSTPSNSREHELAINRTYRLGELTNITTVQSDPNISEIQLRLGSIGSKLCLAIPSPIGYLPIMCKNNPGFTGNDTMGEIFGDVSRCREISDGCDLFSRSSHSRTPNSYFSGAMQCVYESLDIVFFDMRSCEQRYYESRDDGGLYNEDLFENESKLKPFAEFYSTLQLSVSAALTLYVIFYGMRLALNPGEASVQDGFYAAGKLLLVLYFSVGSTSLNWFTGKSSNSNGVTELILPMTISFSESLSGYVFNNSNDTNLCYFSSDDYEDSNYAYFAIFDSLDCRLNTILGMNKIFWSRSKLAASRAIYLPPDSEEFRYDIDYRGVPDALKPAGPEVSEALRSAVRGNSITRGSFIDDEGLNKFIGDATEVGQAIATWFIAICMMIGGGFIPFILILVLIMLVSGLVASIFTSYVVFVLLLYMMAYIAPIFVPMALFDRTYGYFRGWLNLTLSSAVQPIIILGFSAYIFTILDGFLFNGCKFGKYETPSGNIEFVYREPTNTEDRNNCKDSFGYKLYRLCQYPEGWDETSYLLFRLTNLKDVYDLEGSVLPAIVMLIMLTFVVDNLYSLSASITGGLNVASVVLQPAMFITAVTSSYKKFQDLKAEKKDSDKAKESLLEDSVSGG